MPEELFLPVEGCLLVGVVGADNADGADNAVDADRAIMSRWRQWCHRLRRRRRKIIHQILFFEVPLLGTLFIFCCATVKQSVRL